MQTFTCCCAQQIVSASIATESEVSALARFMRSVTMKSASLYDLGRIDMLYLMKVKLARYLS